MGRSKQDWIEETGGFQIGESETQFQQRQWRIQKIRNDIKKGLPEFNNQVQHLRPGGLRHRMRGHGQELQASFEARA